MESELRSEMPDGAMPSAGRPMTPAPSNDDELGNAISEAAGGLSGVIAGASVGSIAGPVGTIIGGVTGALTGWWAGHAIAESARRFDDDHEPEIREQFTADAPDREPILADLSYDDVRPAYRIGFLAGSNPEWDRQSFDDVEPTVRQGWEGISVLGASWEVARTFAEEGFIRARSSGQRTSDPVGIVADTGALSAASIAGGAIDAVRIERAERADSPERSPFAAHDESSEAPTRLI